VYKNEFDETVHSYFQTIKGFKPLTLKEEQKIFKQYKQTGNTNFRDKLVKSNLKYVVSVAKKFKNKTNLSFSELICEGNYGLMIGIEKFNPDKGVKIFTYATHWIQYKISDRIEREINGYENHLNRNVEVDPTTLTARDNTGTTNLDNWRNQLMDWAEEDSLNRENQYKDIVNNLFTELDPREIDVISMRYGLNGTEEQYTLKEVAQHLSLTQERVRQIEDRAINKMRAMSLVHNVEFGNE
jgi:RNA polymerase primary sigma factor